MLIDRRGKLFGKVSIVDIMIVIAILGLFPLVWFLINANIKNNVPIESHNINVTFKVDEVPDVFSDSIQNGLNVKVQQQDAIFGKVVDFSIDDRIVYGTNSSGKWIASAKPNYKSAVFIVEGLGKYSDNQALLNGVELFKGQKIALVVGNTTFYSRVIDIKK